MHNLNTLLGREFTLDTKPARLLLDQNPFKAEDIAHELRQRLITLVIPEIAAVQLFEFHDTDHCYRRFRNMVKLATQPGGVLQLGASLRTFFDLELAGTEIKRSPLYDSEYQREIFGNGGTGRRFALWHEHHRREAQWLDSAGFLALDKTANTRARVEFPEMEDSMKRKASLQHWLEQIPKSLHSSWVLEGLVKDAAQRARVCRTPTRHRSLVSLSYACMVTAVGSATDPRDFGEFKYLKIAKDTWNDARIMSASVYSDALVTNDAGLRGRAELIATWGPYAPKVLSSSEALGFVGAQ